MPNVDFDVTIAAIDADHTGDALKKLLSAGRNGAINETLSYVVSRPGKLIHLKLLLDADANPNFYHGDKRPLYFAIQFFNADTLKYCQTLLDRDASTEELGPTIAHTSASAVQLVACLYREYLPGIGITITETGQLLSKFFSNYNKSTKNSIVKPPPRRLLAS